MQKWGNYMPMITIYEFQSSPENLDRVLAYVIETLQQTGGSLILFPSWCGFFFSLLESVYPNLVKIINF